MKAIRIIPEKIRKRLLISQLQKLRESKERKDSIIARQNVIELSKRIEKRAMDSYNGAKNFSGPKQMGKWIMRTAKNSLVKSRRIDNESREYSSTKLQRKKLRQFFELPKKANKK